MNSGEKARCYNSCQFSDASVEVAKGAYSQGDIIEHDIESRRSPHQVIPHHTTDVLTLGNQLAGVELRNHALEHLVHD